MHLLQKMSPSAPKSVALMINSGSGIVPGYPAIDQLVLLSGGITCAQTISQMRKSNSAVPLMMVICKGSFVISRS